MKTIVVLSLAVLAVSLAKARMTNKQLLQLAKPADDSVKADHEIELTGEQDDEVDFKSILGQMGYEFNFEDSEEEEVEGDVDIVGDTEGIKMTDGTNADLDENVKAGECACSGKTCVCCCVLTFTYEGKRYYITLCVRVTHTGSGFYVELFLQGTKIYATHISSAKTICYHHGSAFKACARFYYVTSHKICLRLYFVVSGKTYSCRSHCLSVSSSRFNSYLKSDDN